MAFSPAWAMARAFLIAALSSPVYIHASLPPVNRTIDDTYGDSVTGALPSYSGSSWSVGQDCSGCSLHPDAAYAFNGSWHDATTQVDPNDNEPSVITLHFQGTAVWIYCILVEISLQYASDYGNNISFELDGNHEGSFIHIPMNTSVGYSSLQPGDSDGQYSYNQIVFSKTGIDNQNHTLVVTAVRGTSPSLILFDWAQYTYAELDVNSSSSSTTTASLSFTSTKPAGSSISSEQSTSGPGSTSSGNTLSGTAQQSSAETRSTMTSTTAILGPSQQSTSRTINTTSPASQSPVLITRAAEHRVGPIIGGVIGSVVFVIFLACLVAFYRKHQASRQFREDTVIQDSYSSTKDANKDPTVFTTSLDANRLIHHPSFVIPIGFSTPRDGLLTYTHSTVSDATRPSDVSQQDDDPLLGPPNLRQSIALSGTEQAGLSSIPYSATSVQLVEPTNDADAHAATSLRYMSAENMEIRRELVSLRTEVMRLQIMRTGDMAVAPEDDLSLGAPPAYF